MLLVKVNGAKLKRLREAGFLSHRELADKADLSPTTVINLENDRGKPHPRTIRKLAEGLGVNPSELVED
jgi:transcriptional regulator with XRE-family HTH domain